MFGLAVIAAVLNLMLLKFMTMNTEDENRDEIEALEVFLRDEVNVPHLNNFVSGCYAYC